MIFIAALDGSMNQEVEISGC